MKHLDLFSGIGGFAYAAQQVWREEYENIGFCEIDRYCQAVLRKRFSGCSIWGDIRTITNTENNIRGGGQQFREETSVRSSGDDKSTGIYSQCDLIKGGFPCQPFSAAGKRKGTADNRYLWPEMLRVIRLFRPRCVIAENVYGIINIEGGMVFEQVCLDLEDEGYEVQPFIIPA